MFLNNTETLRDSFEDKHGFGNELEVEKQITRMPTLTPTQIINTWTSRKHPSRRQEPNPHHMDRVGYF